MEDKCRLLFTNVVSKSLQQAKKIIIIKKKFSGLEDTKTSLLIYSKNTVRIFVCLKDKSYD